MTLPMQLILLDIEALASRAPPLVFDLVAGSLGRGRVTTGEVAPMSPWDDLQGAVIAGDAKAQGVAEAVMGQSNTDAGRMEVLKQLMEQQSVGDWRFLRLETSSSSSEEPVESEPLAKKPKIEVRRMNRVEMQEELKAQGEPVEPGATVNQLRSQLVTARKSVETPMGAAEVQEPLPDKVETPVDAAQKQDKVETEGQEPLPDKVKTPVDAAGDQEPPHDMVETAHAAQKPEESRWSPAPSRACTYKDLFFFLAGGQCAANCWNRALQVDGDEYRGLLMTQDGYLIDVRTMDAQLAKQEHVITKCLGVTYPRELFAMLGRDLDLEVCLQQVKDFESGVGQGYGTVDMPPELSGKLLKLFEHPALEACKVLYSYWENMAVTLWLMKWAAHRLCGTSQLEEFHIYLGGGKNGKSWWIAQLQALFGTYCAMPDSDLLTRFNSQQATPQHMQLRGARLLPFAEMNASHRPQANTLKLYSDHKTVIHARNHVSFRVQFGLVMCSNERLHMSLDGGTDRRLSVAEWPIQFCQVPRLVQVGLKDEQRLADNSPGLLYVLLKVFKVFGAVQDTLVRPWPLWVEQATRSYLQGDSVEFVWESFVETWEMASRPSMECAGYGVVSDAWVAFARTKNVGVSAAGSHFKQAMLRHKHNDRYVAKFLNENQCFKQPKGSA
ncbi:unnamed protein product [Effrenium voratum]|uniref:SF3 helicase domain-containing protein n=1 Tax=Effrenium voratum TaxID=2562239 RepID=A0AA36MYV4_9DINO|nr:unnamed protein product [Effrenium voratum]